MYIVACGQGPDLGDTGTCVLCKCSLDLQAVNTRSAASFQRVVCALLHLLTLPAFANTVLNQCYNPILTVVESSLNMREVCKCVLELSKQDVTPNPCNTPVRTFDLTQEFCPTCYSCFNISLRLQLFAHSNSNVVRFTCVIIVIQVTSVWQPSTWVELVQIVVSFLAKLMSRSGILSEEKLGDMRSHITQLQQAFQAFQSRGSSPGDNRLHNSLNKLERCVQLRIVLFCNR